MKSSALVVSLALLLVGCSHESGHRTGPLSGPALVESDIQALHTVDSLSLQAYDKDSSGLFSAVYGGPSSEDVLDYLSTRIHYYKTQEQFGHFVTAGLNAQIGALNVGTALWMQAAANGLDVLNITDGHQTIRIDSSRVGLMVIGPAYDMKIKTKKGRVTLPVAFRQSILLHEARHSDCTGGLGPDDLAELRRSEEARDMPHLHNKNCGYMHMVCPPGHDLAGEPACDDMPWGAYAVQYIYLLAQPPSHDPVTQAVLDFMTADTRSRLQYDVDALLRGDLGQPDMSSEGVHP